MDNNNNKSKCEQCTKCPPSQTALKECKSSRDRECGCPTGMYHNLAFLICMDCLKCNVGEGVVSPCTNASDTECEPCRKVCVQVTVGVCMRGVGGGGWMINLG